MDPIKISWLSAVCLLALGCTHSVPKELNDARAAYKTASNGPASELAQSDLHDARQALERAEQAFDEDGNDPKTRDHAYVATRKARIAEARARIKLAQTQAVEAREEMDRVEKAAFVQMQGELSTTQTTLEGQPRALAQERARRLEAEARAAQAFADLARIAEVKREARGTVITLPGGVLFASGKSTLLPSAEAKLTQVANALVTSDPDSAMVVEGHTDSQGSEQFNQRLSEKRAQAVRSYLVSHGVAPDRISAQGLGEDNPIADNDSPEGRANNRRVEIVVQPTAGSTQR
jgi:outer membrane protein OmpA-like peptidoglycan-associated protein